MTSDNSIQGFSITSSGHIKKEGWRELFCGAVDPFIDSVKQRIKYIEVFLAKFKFINGTKGKSYCWYYRLVWLRLISLKG